MLRCPIHRFILKELMKQDIQCIYIYLCIWNQTCYWLYCVPMHIGPIYSQARKNAETPKTRWPQRKSGRHFESGAGRTKPARMLAKAMPPVTRPSTAWIRALCLSELNLLILSWCHILFQIMNSIHFHYYRTTRHGVDAGTLHKRIYWHVKKMPCIMIWL